MLEFSVIIPAYNRAHVLPRALESVWKQSHPASQVIVVDDGSTDETVEVCRSYGKRIELIRQPNAGVAAARNRGISATRHVWVAFLDSDDFWTENHLARMADAIGKTEGEADFYFSDMEVRGKGEIHRIWEVSGFDLEGEEALISHATNWLFHTREPWSVQCAVFRAEALRSGAFNTNFRVSEDRELFGRLAIGGTACAVNHLGCVQMEEEDAGNRLSGCLEKDVKTFWQHEVRLWSQWLKSFPQLCLRDRNGMKHHLALAHWRLARLHQEERNWSKAVSEAIHSMLSSPAFFRGLWSRQCSAIWKEKVRAA